MVEERREEKEVWVPKTDIGRKVQKGEITSLEQIFDIGKPILEHQIVDALLPEAREERLEVRITQRMTDCGRKTQYRAVVIVGDGKGHIGIGVGKADETRPSIETAVKNAKRNIIKIPLGCGSWECGCGQKHALPIQVSGKSGGVNITLKPAPRGVGIAANETVRKVLGMAGVKDCWSFSRGRTRSRYNTAMAVFNALRKLNEMRIEKPFEKEEPKPVVIETAQQEIEKQELPNESAGEKQVESQ